MHQIDLPKQKGFIKGKFILDAIITLSESMDYAQESDQNYVYFKIDFDKAYDRVEWDFIFQSLQDIGFGRKFIKYVCTLFGNACAKVAINGEIFAYFPLRRSIRQGCPIAPLLFAICSNALGWLV
ncbi:hypothetical protein L7F22_054285 [Adiantum nelumboides]|nr:hypothetical protein [Adiantum nelumboides]